MTLYEKINHCVKRINLFLLFDKRKNLMYNTIRDFCVCKERGSEENV